VLALASSWQAIEAMEAQLLQAISQLSAAPTPEELIERLLQTLQTLTDEAEVTLHLQHADAWKPVANVSADGKVQLDTMSLAAYLPGIEAAGNGHRITSTNCCTADEQLSQALTCKQTLISDKDVYLRMQLDRTAAVLVMATSDAQAGSTRLTACRTVTQHAELCLRALQRAHAQRALQAAERKVSKLQGELQQAQAEAKACTEQAKEARLSAEQANATQSKFLATISHELRTPMNGITGMSELLLDSQVTSDQREALLIIRNCAEALLLLVNDVLDMSQVETGEFELHNQCFNLRDMIESALDLVADAACNKHLDFAAEIVLTAPIICYGDARRCQQVLTNLMSNSIKFTAEGHIGLEVQSRLCGDADEMKPPSKRYLKPSQQVDAEVDLHTLNLTADWPIWELKFVITDSGIGIDPQYKHMLFKRFSQLPMPLDPMRRGSGLGLSICQQIAHRMHGTVIAESEGVGKGSVFTLTLQLPGRADIGVPRDIAQAISVEELIMHGFTDQPDEDLVSAMTRAYTPTVSLAAVNDEDRNTLVERVTAPELLSSGVLVFHTKMKVAEKVRHTLEAWGIFGRSSDNLPAVAHLIAYSAFLTTLQAYDAKQAGQPQQTTNDILLQVINNVNKSKRCQTQLSAARCLSVINLVHRPFEVVIMVQLADDPLPMQAAKLIKEVHAAVSDQTRYVLRSNQTIDADATNAPGIAVLISATLAYRQVKAVEEGTVSYYLAQPIRPQQLFDSLRKVCDRRRLRSTLREHRRLEVIATSKASRSATSDDDVGSRPASDKVNRSQVNGCSPSSISAQPRTPESDVNSSLSFDVKVLSPKARNTAHSNNQGAAERPLKILVVEDNNLNCKVLGRLLTNLQYTDVTYAYDGLQAITAVCGITLTVEDLTDAETNPAKHCSEATNRNAYDFILMDWQMPHCDGLQATRIIRRFGTTNSALGITGTHPPIVALTANAMIGDREKCLESVMNAYLAKPVRRQELAKLLDNAKQLRDESASQPH